MVERDGETPGGFGEEDFVTLVLPYIRSAREGVLRLGALLEEHGTYEMNGIAFSDAEDIWWLETVGGHHWIARRVPEDHYVTMPNQLGIDSFDLEDAEGPGRDHLASPDLRAFLREYHLDLTLRSGSTGGDTAFNPREAFGSHTEHDHLYNTPRAWYMQRTLSPHAEDWDAGRPGASPAADDLPWSRRPERLLTVEDVKDVLSSHYQGTVFDPYSPRGTDAERRAFRPIGINRHNALAILQIRGDLPAAHRSVQWIAYASLPFTTLIPMFTNVEEAPAYLSTTGETVSTDSFYWTSRMIAALADPHFHQVIPLIERYQQRTMALGRSAVRAADGKAASAGAEEDVPALLAAANTEIAEQVREATEALLGQVLFLASEGMTNRFSRSDG